MQHSYDIQVRRPDKSWGTVFSHVGDEPLLKPEHRIQILNDTTLFFYTDRLFGVTKDQGTSWSFFNIQESSEFANRSSRGIRIKEITMTQNGAGTIISAVSGDGQRNAPVFETADFGETWVEKEPPAR